MTTSPQALSYNYESIQDVATRIALLGYAKEIKKAMRRTVEDIFAIGEILSEAKELFDDNEEFLDWCKAEFDLAKTSVYGFISVAEKFSGIRKRGDECPSLPLPSVLIELASLPDDEVEALLAGEKTIPTAEGPKTVQEATTDEVKRYKKMLEERDKVIKKFEEKLKREHEAAEKLKKKLEELTDESEIKKLKEQLVEKDQRLLTLSQELRETREYYEKRLATGTAHEQKLFEIEVALKNTISKLEKLVSQAETVTLREAITRVCLDAIELLQSITVRVETPTVIDIQKA